MPFMRGIFSRRSRAHEVNNHAVEASTSASASASTSGSNLLGLKQVCAQVAESLLAEGGRDAMKPDAARLERMCLANFTEGELSHLIEDGMIFQTLQIADLLIQRSTPDGETAEQVFTMVSPLFKMSAGVFELGKQIDAYKQGVDPRNTGSLNAGQGAVLPVDSMLETARQMQEQLAQLQALSTSAGQQGASSSTAGPSRPSKPPKAPKDKPIKLPSNWKKFYCPQANYSLVELCALFEKTDKPCYNQAHTQQVLDELLTHLFLGQGNSPEHRMALCEALLRVMSQQNLYSVTFDGRSYSDVFLVTLAADLGLAQLQPNSSTAFRNTVAARLDRLLEVSGAEVTQFTLRGEPCTRRDIVFWARNIRDTKNWVLPDGAATSALAQSMDRTMKVRDAQSVHDLAVTTTGNKVYDLMLRRVEKLPKMSVADVKSQIEGVLAGRTVGDQIRLGLNRVINDQEVSTSIGIPVTPAAVLGVLWQYIQNHERPDIRASLVDALLVRFSEIGSEAPCHVGRLERLLDVPSGIDERLNVFARQKQVREDVRTIAGQVNELDLNAVQKVAEFQRRVTAQLVNAQGMDFNEVQPEINLLIPGFIDDSDHD
jgi:hypothetical protein